MPNAGAGGCLYHRVSSRASAGDRFDGKEIIGGERRLRSYAVMRSVGKAAQLGPNVEVRDPATASRKDPPRMEIAIPPWQRRHLLTRARDASRHVCGYSRVPSEKRRII